jgi:hypothetical protein
LKVLVLLSALLKEGEDANACRADAEALWMLSRRRHTEGQSEAFDYLLAETRIGLDELTEILRIKGPEEFNLDDAVDDAQTMMDNLALQQDDRMETDQFHELSKTANLSHVDN